MARALKFISGKYQGGVFPLPEDQELIVGRSADLDIVLMEDMVSRKHAKLVCNGNTLTVTDLGSTNGTFVNGEKIKRAELELDDRILIGTSIVRVVDGSQVDDDVGTMSAAQEQMLELGSRAPSESTMSGDLEDVPLPDLLQLFATNKKSGILDITGERRGRLYIEGGQLQYAVIGGGRRMPPLKNLCRMLEWREGSFRLEPYETATFPESFKESTESLLIEALRQNDEMKNMMGQLPEPDTEMVMCVPLTPKLSDLSKQDLDTLQMALNFDSVQQVIDQSDTTDAEAVKSLHRLLHDGYLETE